MKRITNGISAAFFFGGALLFGSCSSADKDTMEKRMENMENRIDKSADQTSDWLEFRRESKAEIAENKAKIDNLRIQQENSGQVADKVYEERITQLQNKNERLQQQLNNYEPKDNNWQEFKREFKHDMNELGQSIRDIGRNNKD